MCAGHVYVSGTRSCPQGLLGSGRRCPIPAVGHEEEPTGSLGQHCFSYISPFTDAGGGLVLLWLPLNFCFREVGEGAGEARVVMMMIPDETHCYHLASHLPAGPPLVCRKAVGPATGSDHWDQFLGLETSLTLEHWPDQVPFRCIPRAPTQICCPVLPRLGPGRSQSWWVVGP